MISVGCRVGLALFAAPLLASPALAEELGQTEALAWLQKVASAARDRDYTGTFVYQHGEQVETFRISHFASPNREYEKLETLDGPRRVIIRTDTEVLTYYPDTGVAKRETRASPKSFPSLLPTQLAELTQHYRVRRGSRARIAGYESQSLILEPRDAFRYGHKLWAEVNSGLVLKARMLDERRHVIEQFQFTQVAIDPPLEPDLEFPTPPGPVPPVPEQTDTGWTVHNQPAGFKQIMETMRVKPDGRHRVAHIVLSDGLAAVSVFIEPLPPAAQVPEGSSRQGAVNIYTKSIGGQLVTVLGETPAVTVKQIGDSVGRKDR